MTRRILAEDGITEFTEEAVALKIYPDLCGEGCAARVREAWDPHLDGKVSLATAIDNLVAAWPATELK